MNPTPLAKLKKSAIINGFVICWPRFAGKWIYYWSIFHPPTAEKISGPRSLKEISGFQPNLAVALAGSPSRVSTWKNARKSRNLQTGPTERTPKKNLSNYLVALHSNLLKQGLLGFGFWMDSWSSKGELEEVEETAMFPLLETRQFIIFINPVQQHTLIHFESIFELYAPHAMLFVLLPIFELEN